MRNAFAKAAISLAKREEFFFLTGDLGFMALEAVEKAYGERFINAGVAEQNMVGVAAGLSKEGAKVFVYSIAPFCYARPFEQIRNDVVMPSLPICLVGNGGGYGYGHMGPTHHALEDCAAMQALGVQVLVPAFDDDIAVLLKEINQPCYLRLGYDIHPTSERVPEYSAWRKILTGSRGVVIALGPLAGLAWQAFISMPEEDRPEIWVVCEFTPPPEIFIQSIHKKNIWVIEEHIAHGGLGMYLSYYFLKNNIAPKQFVHRYALGYPTGRYGSQAFHRQQCGLDQASLLAMVSEGR